MGLGGLVSLGGDRWDLGEGVTFPFNGICEGFLGGRGGVLSEITLSLKPLFSSVLSEGSVEVDDSRVRSDFAVLAVSLRDPGWE